MRQRLLREFDDITIDHLNGDSRETGKKTPDGRARPVHLLDAAEPGRHHPRRRRSACSSAPPNTHDRRRPAVRYRDFWGEDKREQLAAATADPDAGARV